MAISKNAALLLKQRYCRKGEAPRDVYKRVAAALALGDGKFEKQLYQAMYKGIFLPNSPALRSAGTKEAILHACFVLPIRDSIESIFDTIKHMAIIFHHGGGVGINYTPLRPKDAPLSSGGTSSGALSFIEIFDMVTNCVKQGGFRRGASLGVLDYNHPEIVEFIRSKLTGKLTNFNISVLVNDEFMNKVISDENIELINPHDKSVSGNIKAKNLLDLISFCAWSSGDPGILFFDRINRDNPDYPKHPIIACNPCGESPLFENLACCLGSINISKFVKGNKFDFEKFKIYVKLATRALLNMNAVSAYPLPQITKMMKKYNPVGVGIMGMADCLIKLGIYYDSEECLNFIDELGKIYKRETDRMAKGSFYKRIIAPTGSLSILADCSSGIEPLFETIFEKHLTIGVITETRDLYKSKFVRTAHQISPEWHLKVQAKWQEWLDGAASKTINLPYEASVDNIRDIYISAWEMGCKGVTIFRDGSKAGVYKAVKCNDETCHL